MGALKAPGVRPVSEIFLGASEASSSGPSLPSHQESGPAECSWVLVWIPARDDYSQPGVLAE